MKLELVRDLVATSDELLTLLDLMMEQDGMAEDAPGNFMITCTVKLHY